MPSTNVAAGWSGTGAMMTNGEYTGLGIAKHCPECGEFYGFISFSALVGDETDDD